MNHNTREPPLDLNGFLHESPPQSSVAKDDFAEFTQRNNNTTLCKCSDVQFRKHRIIKVLMSTFKLVGD